MPKQDTKVSKKADDTKNKLILFTIVKWLLIIAIVLVVLFLATSPLRGKAADNFVQKGDSLLLQKKYISAELEYQKALSLNSSNAIAKDHKALAIRAAANISEFERFFDLPQFSTLRDKYSEATAVPNTQSEAVRLSRQLIEEGEYQLAIFPAKTATEMDSEYRDAWLYLGIANLKTAQLVELTPDAKSIYIDQAKKAFNKTLQLDPQNQTAMEIIGKM